MSNGDPGQNPAVTLGNALALVFDAIALTRVGLLCNPSREELRALNDQLNELSLAQASIEAKLDALMTGSAPVAGPSKAQVDEVAALTGQVQALTTASTTASAAVALTTRVLVVATQIASGTHGSGGPPSGNPPRS